MRHFCWSQNSSDSSIANKVDWQDCLDRDPSAVHWVILDGPRIVASARLNILDDKSQLPYPDVFNAIDVPCKSFAFYSRLVVDPDYRSRGYSLALDKIRLQYMIDNRINFALATARGWRLGKLRNIGFKVVAPVNSGVDPRWDLGNASIITIRKKDIVL
ncbi:MAG: GNAT family N-acetyltransferase [Halieaceae bacterium]